MAKYPREARERREGTPEQDATQMVGELGYRLLLREPWWYGHRMLIAAAEDVHLHVWPVDAAEPIRHRLFRDWLRSHPADRERYEAAKRGLVRSTVDDPSAYTMSKSDVIDQIFARVFAADDEANVSGPSP